MQQCVLRVAVCFDNNKAAGAMRNYALVCAVHRLCFSPTCRSLGWYNYPARVCLSELLVHNGHIRAAIASIFIRKLPEPHSSSRLGGFCSSVHNGDERGSDDKLISCEENRLQDSEKLWGKV